MKRATLSIFLSLSLIFVLSAGSETLDQHFDKARKMLNTGRYDDAAKEFESVAKLSFNDKKIQQNAVYWIGQCHFKAGRYDEALSTFRKIIYDYPNSEIVPVTRLMMAQAEKEKENKREENKVVSDNGVITDPKSGVKYTRIKTFEGKDDIIQFNTGLNLSPNGKFLLSNNLIIPMDGGESFDLVDSLKMPLCRATWSPDGEKMVFYSGGIWLVPVSSKTGHPTGPAKKIVEGAYWYQSNVSWSPDSEKIAFEIADENARGDIYTFSIKDGKLLKITDSPEREYYPSWSPDGKNIAYGSKYNSIWLITAEGGQGKKIADSVGKANPLWIPDSKWIFCNAGTKLQFFRLADNYRLDLDISKIAGDFLSWSKDGRKMLFYQPSYDYKSTLKVVSSSGGPYMELGRQLTLWMFDQWSSDSKMIITRGENKDGDITLWIVPLSGDAPFTLEMNVSVAGKIIPCTVSPKAEKLAFVIHRDDGKEDLWMVPISLKDGKTTGLAVMAFSGWNHSGGYNVITSWSPDETKLAVINDGDVWVASDSGSKPIQLTKTSEIESRPGWSPDGKNIAYIRYPNTGAANLCVIPASGGESRKLLENCSAFAWSPKGKSLAVFSEAKISVISLSNGKSGIILDLKEIGADDVWELCWSTNAQSITFVCRKKGGDDSNRLFMVPAKGGKATELASDDKGDKYSLHWSPDGKWIGYNSDGFVKTRPEGVIWEADITGFLNKAEKKEGR